MTLFWGIAFQSNQKSDPSFILWNDKYPTATRYVYNLLPLPTMPNIPVFGKPITAAMLLDNTHLISMLLAYCDVRDIVHFAASTKVNAATAHEYLNCHLRDVILPFVENTKQFFKIMCTCDAVISGSVALHFLLSTNQTNWTPTDLDLYVPQANACQLVSLLGDHGYQVVHQGEVDNSPYTHSNIHTMLTLSNGIRKINVGL